MEYLDFKLEINRINRRYQARVRSAPAGKGARAWVTLPAKRLENLRTSLVNCRSGDGARNLTIETPQLESVPDLGLQLFHSIFHDEVLESWRISQAQAPSRLRLRLSLDDDPSLLSIPWELLFDPELNDFLATVIPVVRSLDLRTDHQRSLAGPSPLHILTVLSCPSDCVPLEVEQEWSAMDEVLGSSVEMRSVPPRLEKIDQALQAEEWHVLHFVGHGYTDERGGVLVLEDQEGGSRPIGHLRLGKFLGHSSLRLIVLNACDGGQPGRKDAFSGVAQALLRKGIPAVVAMQQPISDRAAVSFARELYRAIAEGLPLDGALAVARERLYRDFETMEWAIPVLYLNAPNGEIIGKAKSNPWKRIALITAGVLLLGTLVSFSLRSPDRPQPSGPTPNPEPRPPAVVNPPECPSPPGLDMAFVRVRPGKFEMGESKGDKTDEPVHQVEITRPFCMGAFEVTQEQWNRIMGGVETSLADRYLPAGRITYAAAQEFIRRLNDLEPSRPYRLPTEAEWEYAARAKTSARFSLADTPTLLRHYANCKNQDKFDGPAPVGSFRPNDFGLYDMNGNAFEWVSDWYGEYPDEKKPDPLGPPTGSRRIRRGGSWESGPKACSSTARSDVEPDRKDQETGLRILREIH